MAKDVHAGQKPTFPRPFQSPVGLANTTKTMDYDRWFIETWQASAAINKPQGNLKLAATRLSRNTVRQAWWNVLHSLESYTFGMDYKEVKAWADKVQKLSSKLKEHFGAKPIHLIEGGLLGEARIRIETALSPFEIEAAQCSKKLREKVKNIGAPELMAFTRPFVEAAIFMTGTLPQVEQSNRGHYRMADAIDAAWHDCCGGERADWMWQIRMVRIGLPSNLQALTTEMPNQYRPGDNFYV